MEVAAKCPQCKRTSNGPSSRLVQDTCGHKKCRPCLLSDEIRCKLCQEAMPPKKKAWPPPGNPDQQNKDGTVKRNESRGANKDGAAQKNGPKCINKAEKDESNKNGAAEKNQEKCKDEVAGKNEPKVTNEDVATLKIEGGEGKNGSDLIDINESNKNIRFDRNEEMLEKKNGVESVEELGKKEISEAAKKNNDYKIDQIKKMKWETLRSKGLEAVKRKCGNPARRKAVKKNTVEAENEVINEKESKGLLKKKSVKIMKKRNVEKSNKTKDLTQIDPSDEVEETNCNNLLLPHHITEVGEDEFNCKICNNSFSGNDVEHHLSCNQENPSEKLDETQNGQRVPQECTHGNNTRCKSCPTKKRERSPVDELSDDLEEELKENNGETVKRNYSNFTIPSHVVAEREDTFKCTICDKSFTSKYHVKYHLYCNGAKKPIQCEKCNKSFIKKSHFETHMLMHENKRPFECDKCGKRFLERSKLKRHKFTHSQDKSFICAECGKAFKTKENLRTHRLIHTPEKWYGCPDCDAKFNHSSNLKKHLLKHKSEKAHKCDECDKRFKLKWALKMHKRCHLKIRPIECQTCERTFISLKDMQRHQIIHLDIKEYTCGICGTSFNRRDNLNRHSRNTHPGKKPVIVKSKKVPRKPPADNPNAINVIKSAPSVIVNKDINVPTKQASVISYVNAPLKLAFKTPAFKNNYNIHRDYVEPDESKLPEPRIPEVTAARKSHLGELTPQKREQNVPEASEPETPPEPVNIYEKILITMSPTQKEPVEVTLNNEKTQPLPVSQRFFAPFAAPLHYETSFDNKKHAIIKNIKFKLPAEYTKLKTRDSEDEPKHGPEPKPVTVIANPSVIVNSASNNNESYYNLHWRRRTAQVLNLKYR